MELSFLREYLKGGEKMWKVVKEGDDFVIYVSKERCPKVFPEPPPGWEAYNCGGGYPYFVVYNPEKIAVVWLSAKETKKWENGDLYLRDPEKLISELPASVHDCWKLTCNQTVLVLQQPYELCEVEYSAYELAEERDETLPSCVVGQALERSFDLPVDVEEENCPHCKKKRERLLAKARDSFEVAMAQYKVCLGHAVLESLNSSTFNESRRYDFNYRIRSDHPEVEKALLQPTQKIDYAFLTKDGTVYLVVGDYSFKTKDRWIRDLLFKTSEEVVR